jgi:hypothetical protein
MRARQRSLPIPDLGCDLRTTLVIIEACCALESQADFVPIGVDRDYGFQTHERLQAAWRSRERD